MGVIEYNQGSGILTAANLKWSENGWWEAETEETYWFKSHIPTVHGSGIIPSMGKFQWVDDGWELAEDPEDKQCTCDIQQLINKGCNCGGS